MPHASHRIAPGKKPEDFLFTRENGEVVKDFRITWDKLTEAAGVPGLLLHDFRRSSVRNLIRRGVPQKTARTDLGHKTDAVFARYYILSEDDIRDAAMRIEEGAEAAVSGVIPTSFPLAPNQGNEGVASKDRKPS
jgi:integrase